MIYCDEADIPFLHPETKTPMLMSHLVADSLDELHSAAERLGVDRRHFQNKFTPHYDIAKTKRLLAVKHLGVMIVSRHDMGLLVRQWREAKNCGEVSIKGLGLVEGNQLGLNL
jgi:hypothetical protein